MSITAAQLIARVSVEGAEKAQAQLMGLGASSDNAAAKFAGLAVGAGALLAGALVVIGAVSAKMAGDFEQSTNTLITSAGLSKNSIDAVRQGILRMSVDTATSTDQLVKGMFNVQSALHLGAGGLQVLKAAAQGAKAENSDLAATTDVLTTAMVNYHLGAAAAVPTMNSLIVTIAAGKMHMVDLTGALKNVLPVAAAFHVHLSDVEGALASMANAGDRGTIAGTHLAMMFKMLSSPVGAAKKEMAAMGLDSIKLAQTMQTSLPGALKMIQDAVTAHFKPGSVEYNRAILAILGGSKSGVAGLEIFNQGLKTLGKNTGDAAGALRKGSKDVENWSVIQGGFNFKLTAAKNAVEALFIKIGTALLPTLSGLLDKVTPLIARFADWVTSSGTLQTTINVLVTGVTGLFNGIGLLAGILSTIIGFFVNNQLAADALAGALVGAAAVIGAVVIPGLVAGFIAWAVAAGAAAIATIAATWPLLLIGAAIALLVTGIILAIQHWGAIMDWITGKMEQTRIAHEQKMVAMKIAADNHTAAMATKVIANLEKERSGIIAKLHSAHTESEKLHLQHELAVNDIQIKAQQTRIQIAENDKKKQLAKQKELHDQMLEAQKWFGARFLDMTIVWTGNVFSAIGTWTHNVLSTIGRWFGSIMSAVGTFTHNFLSAIGQWIGNVSSAIGTFTRNVLTTIKNWFGNIFNTLGTFVHNFLSTIGQWKDSVILKVAQMVTDFVNWIKSIPSRLASLAGSLVAAGAQIVQNIASGIMGAIGGALGNAMGAVGNFISSHLPHSPAKVGPLRDLQVQGSLIPQQIAAGLLVGQHHLDSAMGQLLKPIVASVRTSLSLSAPSLSALGNTSVSGGLSSSAGLLSGSVARTSIAGGGTTVVNNITVQSPDVFMDGVRTSRALLPHFHRAILYNTGHIGP